MLSPLLPQLVVFTLQSRRGVGWGVPELQMKSLVFIQTYNCWKVNAYKYKSLKCSSFDGTLTLFFALGSLATVPPKDKVLNFKISS